MAVMARSMILVVICAWQATGQLMEDIGDLKFDAMKNGKITLKNMDQSIMVSVGSIEEKDMQGNFVPANDSINPHKAMNMGTMMYDMPAKAMYHNSSSPHYYSFDMSSKIMLKEENATLEVHVKVAMTNGTVIAVPATTKFNVMKGSLLIGIKVNSWPFCGKSGITPCMKNVTKVMGKFLDVVLKVDAMDFVKKNQSWYSGDVMLQLSDEVKMDSNDPKKVPNHPMVSKDMITIRFEDFDTMAEYKYLHLVAQTKKTSDGNRATGVGILTMTVSLLAYLLGFLS